MFIYSLIGILNLSSYNYTIFLFGFIGISFATGKFQGILL